jgi:aldehyde:ferredoxin oxidoreductase
MELAFNRAAGFSRISDSLPEFFKIEPLSPRGLVFDVSDKDLDQVLCAL